MKLHARAYRAKHKKGTMNGTEAAYAHHLHMLKLAGEIVDYAFEPETLRIGPDCRYTPDFRVIKHIRHDDEGFLPLQYQFEQIEFHEVKGTIRKSQKVDKPYIEDDALVKIKAASEQHPYKFIIVWKGQNGSWERKEIN